MKITPLTKKVLAVRRQQRAMLLAGYEEITMAFGIGRLWELDRGRRVGWKLVDVKLGVGGKSVFVRAAPSHQVPDTIDVKRLREGLGMSQPEFALKFGFSLGTVRQWEHGRRYPDGPARVLLTVIEHSPNAVKEALESVAERRAAVG